MSYSTRSRGESAGLIVGLILVVVVLIAWTLFGYGVMIAAFVALDGILKVLMGVYIVGSLILFGLTMFVKNAVRR